MDSPFSQRRLDHAGTHAVHHHKRHAHALRKRFAAVTAWVKNFLSKEEHTLAGRWNWRRVAKKTLIAAPVIVLLWVAYLWWTLPNIDDPRNLFASQSSVILDRNGTELYRLFAEQDRTYIPASSMPKHLKDAVVAIEDERFYDRGCIDYQAMARVVLRLGSAGGASTLTRQLARNALDLKQENLLNRKVKELILGCQLESRFSREELLELYLNWIPFGKNAFGVEQASRVYFGKSASGLTLAESAVLASLPQRPTYFSPYGSHVRTTVTPEVRERIATGRITRISQIDDDDITIGLLGGNIGSGSTTLSIGGRADQVLANMERLGMIEEADRLQALNEFATMNFAQAREDIRAAHFVLWVKDQAASILGLSPDSDILQRGGLRIETTIDWEMQQDAEKVVASHSGDTLARFGAHNIALLAADRTTREVLAYVGNTEYGDTEHGGKIDMVQAPRQPGSSFKPFVYAAAFLKGMTPATVLYDVPTRFGVDKPKDYDGMYLGLMSARTALAHSRNIPAAKAFFLAGGEEPILTLVSQLGAPTPKERRAQLTQERGETFEYGWPLALGAGETPLWEMVQAYGTIADGGAYKPLIALKRIVDRNGNILFEAQQPSAQVLDPRIAYMVTSVLSDPAARPEGFWRDQLSIPGYATAGKTGTSNKCLERGENGVCKLQKPDNAWAMGFTPAIVAGVWAGNADSSAMLDRGDGLNTSAPIWKEFLMRAQKRLANAPTTFTQPPGLIQVQVSRLSGQLPTDCTPLDQRTTDMFLQEAPPTLQDPACVHTTVDRVTGLLASESCPASAREEQSFLALTSEYPGRFPEWQQDLDAWGKEQNAKWAAAPDHSGAILPLPAAPTTSCDPSLTPGRLEQPTVTLLAPQNGGHATYPAFQPQISFTVGSTVREVRYTIDGHDVGTAIAEPWTQPLRVPRSVSEGGEHTLTVTLVDEYYNEATDTAQFNFEEDTDTPQVTIRTPLNGTVLKKGESLVIDAQAEDSGGLKYVQFYLDDVLLTTKPQPPYTFTYSSTIDAGTHTVRVEAEDMAKNTGSDEVEITVQ